MQLKEAEQKSLNLNKRINDLENDVNEKDLLINKLQKKIARLNAVSIYY